MVAAAEGDAALIGDGDDVVGVDVLEEKTDDAGMILAGAESLREVIPFPKTARAVDLMVDAPTPVSEAQLRDLGIQVRKISP